jgi:hypothetical protein
MNDPECLLSRRAGNSGSGGADYEEGHSEQYQQHLDFAAVNSAERDQEAFLHGVFSLVVET